MLIFPRLQIPKWLCTEQFERQWSKLFIERFGWFLGGNWGVEVLQFTLRESALTVDVSGQTYLTKSICDAIHWTNAHARVITNVFQEYLVKQHSTQNITCIRGFSNSHFLHYWNRTKKPEYNSCTYDE
eukprot:6465761-Amphidinium_carterae.1